MRGRTKRRFVRATSTARIGWAFVMVVLLLVLLVVVVAVVGMRRRMTGVGLMVVVLLLSWRRLLLVRVVDALVVLMRCELVKWVETVEGRVRVASSAMVFAKVLCGRRREVERTVVVPDKRIGTLLLFY